MLLIPLPVPGQEPLPDEPKIAPASDEGQQAISLFQFPDTLQCQLFAAEPMVANPVAFYVDNAGKVFVCESFRQEQGVEDNRNHAEWLDEDLAARSVADRVNYIRRHWANQIDHYTRQDDRIRLLVDRDGDGAADEVSVFADHFNQIAMGTGAGVLSWRDNVYFTCIPDLWLLRDDNHDGVSDLRQSLHNGFGVRFAFRGHDMHGLIMGPDGRLYFSIGDRGYNVSAEVVDPASGAVFRCEADGSQLEVVATGLRNPQELAFDEYGNLFTGDNNSDSGDRARWVFVVPGGDSGWRMYYQYLPDRGPFNRERIWHPYDADTPAWIVPPVTNLADGPSGLAYYPGSGFGDAFRGRFFLCDFRGEATHSGVRSFRTRPVGAFWEVVDMEETIWKTLATDVQFGPDGRLYLSDWVFGWVGENKGRIYAFRDPVECESETVRQTRQLLGGGIHAADDNELASFLGHVDQRVRQESQFEMVDRGMSEPLFRIAGSDGMQLARIHAIWGISQIARRAADDRKGLDGKIEVLASQLLSDSDPEIRAQAARLSGDCRIVTAAPALAGLLSDDSLRVRYLAAMALAQIGDRSRFEALFQMLAENNDADPIVRHGAIMMMAGIARRDPDALQQLAQLADHPVFSVRVAACVALRKLAAPQIEVFLGDDDPRIVVEAARAIYDLPIETAMPKLAALLEQVSFPDELVRRVLNANLRIGGPENALAIGAFAANEDAPLERRIEALQILANWKTPQPRDRVLGDWRPLQPDRPLVDATRALNRHLDGLINGTDEIVDEFIAVAGKLRLDKAIPFLESVALDASREDRSRTRAFVSLQQIEPDNLASIVEQLLADWEQLPVELSASVVERVSGRDPALALALIKKVVVGGGAVEDTSRQKAFLKTLGGMSDAASASLLADLLDDALDGRFPAGNRLDLVMAARRRTEEAVTVALSRYDAHHLSGSDPLAPYVDTLLGGDAVAGHRLFFEKTELSCLRCHKIGGVGGDVGPDLSAVGRDKDRRYLLESILDPNKTIAEGFSQTMFLTDDGVLHTGLVVEQDDSELTLLDADGKRTTILRDSIEEEKKGQSSMPTDLVKHLSPAELRDLIEFLSRQTAGPAARAD
jgi:quinoprotein glucose dehydrogenase